MSDLSRFLKRQEGNVRGLYDKNLGSFVEEWKRPALGMATGMLPGAIAAGIPGGAAMAPYLLAAGGVGGAAAGYQRTQDQKDKWAAAHDLELQNRAKTNAGIALDEEIDPYLPGDPSAPETPYTPPVQPPVSVEPPIDSETGAPVELPGVRPDMGNIDVGGPAGQSAGTILDETERARQMQMDLWNQRQGYQEQIRSEMAEMLNQQMERQFSDQVPGYLEDLNTRGLLRSSALGDRLSTERAKMSAGVNEQLAMQGFQDQYGGLDQLGGIQDQYLQGRQSAMSRKFSLEDYAQQTKAAQLLGQATTPITPYSGGGKSGSTQAGMAGLGLGMSAMGGK